MALSKKKQAKIERKAREDYVKLCSFNGNLGSPFLDYYWDTAAERYIETGDESLKSQFPGPREDRKKHGVPLRRKV